MLLCSFPLLQLFILTWGVFDFKKFLLIILLSRPECYNWSITPLKCLFGEFLSFFFKNGFTDKIVISSNLFKPLAADVNLLNIALFPGPNVTPEVSYPYEFLTEGREGTLISSSF